MQPPSSHPSRVFDELRVLIADDHRLFAESLRALLCEDERIEVVGLATDGEKAVQLTTALLPDVVLMDLNMPGIDGLEATRRIRDSGVPARVLLLTGAKEDVSMADALEAGAVGFLRKENGADDFRQVFFEVASLTSVLAAETS